VALPQRGRSRRAASPAADYKIEAEYSEKSPDGQTIIEQYHKEDSDGEWHWQFWARRSDTQSLLNSDEDADYPADFRFTNDCRFCGTHAKDQFGRSEPLSLQIRRQRFCQRNQKAARRSRLGLFQEPPGVQKSQDAGLPHFGGPLKGTEENYRWMGVNWPENRYLVISLWGEVEPNSHHHQLFAVRGWHVRYDLETGKFDVPPEFRDDNAKALDPKGEDRPFGLASNL
jgi:hypothetical protein